MRKEVLRTIKNIGISVLFVGVVVYGVSYYAGTFKENEAAKVQIAIEGEVVPPTVQEQELDVQENDDGAKDMPQNFCDIMAAVTTGDVTQNIKMYVQDGMCCFFLPSYGDTSEVVWRYDEERYAITCNEQVVKNGDRVIDTGQGEAALTVRQTETGDETEYRLRVMYSSGIPAFYIDTDSGVISNRDTAGEHEEDGQEIWSESGRFVCVSETGEMDSEGTFDQISPREYGEFQAAKRNYEIDCEAEQSILGLDSSSRWMLQANAYDLSRMRNKIAYDMAEDMGMPYGVESSYADVWINGEYAGNYLICKENGKEEEREALQSYVDRSVDRVIYCGTEEDYRQLREKIDLDSFIQIYILSELLNEPELNRKNIFYLTPDTGDSKLYAGLDLDWDRSLGNAEGAYFEALTCFIPGISEKLLACEYFRQDAAGKFNAQYAPVIEQYIDQKNEEYAGQIRDSVRMDDIRWSAPKDNHYMDFNHSYADFEDAVRYVSYYLQCRYELIRRYLNEPGKWHQAEFVNTAMETGYDSRRYWVEDGEKIPGEVLDYLQGTFGCDGWKYEDGREYENGRPIYQDIKFLSYEEENGEQEVVLMENQETENEGQGTGYSKRFVVSGMLLAAVCAGACGLLIGGGIVVVFFRERQSGYEDSNTIMRS